MAGDHSTELQLNHTDNITTNTNNTSTTSTTKNKSAKIDTPEKQTPTNQLSLNKGLDNQLDIIAPPSITRPLSFLEKNNNTINIKCYFNQPHILEELTSKDDTRIQQIHKNIHKLFEDILSPSAFKIIGATAFVNCNVDKLTSIINLQNQLALNIDKLNNEISHKSDSSNNNNGKNSLSMSNPTDPTIVPQKPLQSQPNKPSAPTPNTINTRRSSNALTTQPVNTGAAKPRFTENPNNQHNSYQKAVDTLQLLISKLPPRPTISILTELNSSPLQLKHYFPDHIISVTKRGNGVIIINHNPNTLKLKHISTIDITNQSQNNKEISHKSDSSNNNNGKNSLSMTINIINHLITNHNNTSINQFTNWSKVKSKIIKTLKNYQYNKDKQTQRSKQILLGKAAKFKHLEEQCIAEYNIICNKNKLHQNHTNILKKHINGEIPCKYLSAILNKRSKHAKIESIQYGNIITSDPDQIENAFVEFYTNLYSLQICCPITHQLMPNTWPIIKNEYLNGLDSPFIQDEVEAAIKTCNPNESPGPDGVTNAFYFNHLNQVKPILTTLFYDILENPHHITTEFTEGLIHTIYKKGNPLLISNRRPITLLNTDYKILSKVINARLLRILPFIINNNQTGFLLFDSQAKISINGKTTRKFDIKRGVKQGDPISATLFVIVIEILARTINADNTIIGLPISSNPQIKIKFTQFADESTTYNINYEQQQSIKHFDNLCAKTSSSLNFDKSAIIEINPHKITDKHIINNVPQSKRIPITKKD
ncbi:hypothetical protein ACTFIT_008763 [Dictyostelium discoideum]